MLISASPSGIPINIPESYRYIVGNEPGDYVSGQAAVDAVVAAGEGTPEFPATIFFRAGTYVGNIALTTGGISLVAESDNYNTPIVGLTGTITLTDPGVPDGFPSYLLQGFYIEGRVIGDGNASISPLIRVFRDCLINGAGSGHDTVTDQTVGSFSSWEFHTTQVTNDAHLSFYAATGRAALVQCLDESDMGQLDIESGTLVGRYSTFRENAVSGVCANVRENAVASLSFCSLIGTLALANTAGGVSRLYKNVFVASVAAGPAVSVGGTTIVTHGGGNVLDGSTFSSPAFPPDSPTVIREQSWEDPQTRTVTGTTVTVAASDNGGTIVCTNAGAIAATVPAGLPAGFACTLIQDGAGQITVAGSGATVNGRNGLKSAGQYAPMGIQWVAADSYVVGGDVTP